MNKLRGKAEKLRRLGYSYGMINEKLAISKSTLSNWLNKVEFNPNQEVIERIGKARLKSALYRHGLKLKDIAQRKQEAIQEVGKLIKRDLFMLGIGVYLGEGSKAIEEIRISNSDPVIIKLALKWLRRFCGLEEHHFRITIHSYPDVDNRKALQFWSKETAIPVAQFTKTVIDNRRGKSALRRRKLLYGTAHLYVRGGGTLFPGVKSLHRKIIGWIENIERQVDAGVV